MYTELTFVYEVYSISMGIPFRHCYCELVAVEDGKLRLLNPFRQVFYHTELGTICCRENITHSEDLPMGQFDYAVFPAMAWMELLYDDVLAANQLCNEVFQPLPENGFRRMGL